MEMPISKRKPDIRIQYAMAAVSRVINEMITAALANFGPTNDGKRRKLHDVNVGADLVVPHHLGHSDNQGACVKSRAAMNSVRNIPSVNPPKTGEEEKHIKEKEFSIIFQSPSLIITLQSLFAQLDQ